MAEANNLSDELQTVNASLMNLARKWQDEPGDERQQAHTFVLELFGCYGITEVDAAVYERRVKRSSTGNQGYIDALLPGVALIEMKSKGQNLEKAEEQALDYVLNLPEAEKPRYIVCSDFTNFRVLDLLSSDFALVIAGSDPQSHPQPSTVNTFTLQQLSNRPDFLNFLASKEVRHFGDNEQGEVSVKAAKLLGELYATLEGSGYNEHEAGIFMVRTLFALYADDAGMWESGLFTEFITEHTNANGSDLGALITDLYQTMNTQNDKRSNYIDAFTNRFPYVNGGIFEGALSIPKFSQKMREQLIICCNFDWSKISPAIFGSLFQAVKSKEARRELGEHYTTETNILKTIHPLFLDELYAKYKRNYSDIKALEKLRVELGELHFIDPACGCGNFIVVTYREIRELELQITKRLIELDSKYSNTLLFTNDNIYTKLNHFHGIEIEEWPAQIARVALQLAKHQADQRMQELLGSAPNSLPLKKIDTIHNENALTLDWNDVIPASENVVILGNPPFAGVGTTSEEMKETFKQVWHGVNVGNLDFVTAWFRKAADYFTHNPETNSHHSELSPRHSELVSESHPIKGRFAFVSTNSITQGEQVPILFRAIFDAGWRIRFAHRTFAWSSEASGKAAVHCVITGFDRNIGKKAELFNYPDPKQNDRPVIEKVNNVNGYLAAGRNIFIERRSKPLSVKLPEVLYGSKLADGGNLIVEIEDYPAFAADPIAKQFVHPFIGARELLHGEKRYCLWLEGVHPSEFLKSPIIKQRIEAVKHFRENSTPTGDAYKLRDTPHLFRANKSRPTTPYLCIPSVVSETRQYFIASRLEPETIASNAVFTAQDPDGFLFAIISSKMFITWQKAIGGRLKSDIRFSKDIVWNNFPLPEVSESDRNAIIEAGKAILTERAKYPNITLADQYNPLAMDPSLQKAHNALDKLINKAFTLTPTPTDEQRLEKLFEQYLTMTSN